MTTLSAPAPARSLAGRAIRGGAVLLAARLIMQVFVWSVTLLVARLLTPFDYGVMTVGMVVIGLADMIAEAGLGRALIQKADLQATDIAGAFTVSLALAAVLYAGLAALAPLVSVFLEMPLLTGFLPILGLVVLAVPFRTISLALLDRQLHLGRQAIVTVLCSTAQSATVLGLALSGWGYWALAIGAILARVLETLTLLWAARWPPQVCWPRNEHRALIVFGIQASLGTLLWFFYSNADFALVGKLLGPVELGFYSLAFQLMSLPVQKLTANINQVAYPVFCRLQNDRPRLRDWYLRLTLLLGVFGAPALAGMALVADDAFRVVLGERWLKAVMPFQLLSLVGIVMVYSASIPPLLNALGRPDVVLRYAFASAVIMPTAFLAGGLGAGIVGVCLAWLILFPLIVAFLVILTRSITNIGLLDLLTVQLPVIIGVLAMALTVLAVRPALAGLERAWFRLAITIAVGASTYATTLLLLGRQTVLADLRILWRELRGGRT